MSDRSILRWLFLVLCGLGNPLAWFDAAAAEPDVVVLPPFIVEEATLDPPWRYARTGRFEILSCCPDRVTRELAETVLRAYELLHGFLPESFLGRSVVPDALIFFDEYYWPVASREAIATRLRSGLPFELPLDGMSSGVRAAPPAAGAGRRIVRLEPLISGGDLHWEAPPPGRRPDFFSHLRLADADSMTTFVLVSHSIPDLDGWHLSPGSVRELMERRVPSLPSWFVAGFMGIYRELQFDGGAMTVPPAIWLSDEETRKVIRDPASATAVLPLAELFAEASPGIADAALVRLSQAELFLRWALEPGQMARNEALWKFVERGCSEPEDEAMFVECFGAGFAEVTTRLAEFLPIAVRKPVSWRAPETRVRPPLDLREASRSEIARIKGNWERLETRYVRRQLPSLESKYYELARRTLTREDDVIDRDPGVLAVLGLLERDAGNLGEAQTCLAEAVRHGAVRPQASFALAALRFDELRGMSRRAEHALDRSEAGEVLELLVPARRQAPPLLEVYELVGAVWTNCIDAPHPDDLAVLDEGAAFFPRESGFILQVASLHAAHGSAERVTALVEIGLRHAADDDLRQRLVALRERIAAQLESRDHPQTEPAHVEFPEPAQ